MHPKIVSERLGHSTVGITLDTYSHVMPGMQEEAAKRIDIALRAALKKRKPSRDRCAGACGKIVDPQASVSA